MKARHAIEWYRVGPEVAPSAEIDAFVLAAARASPAPVRRHRMEFLAGATMAAVVATLFYVGVATTPTQDSASAGHGREEGLARAWLMNLDLQKPTGPGSQEGLP